MYTSDTSNTQNYVLFVLIIDLECSKHHYQNGGNIDPGGQESSNTVIDGNLGNCL